MKDNIKIMHALYLTSETIKEEFTIKDVLGTETYSYKDLWDYENNLCGLESLIAQPQYFNKEHVEFIKDKNIKCLYLTDRFISRLFEKDNKKYKTLADLSFLEDLVHLKCFKMDAHTHFFNDKPVIKVEDYRPIEKLTKLECIYIPDNGDYPVFVDIDFSQLKQLKEFDLQFPKENKTIYQCQNIESAETLYYEADFSMIQNWKSLKRFGAYFDKLKSFEGLENFKHLKEFKGQFTSKLKSFEGLKSKSIETFFYYSEAKNTPTSLAGISGLENVKLLKFSGLKKLETIADLTQCSTLEEVWFEESKVPSDIEKLAQMPNLKKVFIDYPGDVVKQYPKLKPLMQWVLGE
jgi:hypothetical protein